MAQYCYLSTHIREVMADIDKYVIPENRAAIEYLWDMNILTTQTNNYENDSSFICMGKLSEENEDKMWRIYNKLIRQGARLPMIGIVYGGKGIEIPVKPGTCDTFDYFKPLIDIFSFQDVQKDGYMTIDEFFIKYTDCWKIIMNPDYRYYPCPHHRDYPDIIEYNEAYDKYIESQLTPKKIRVYDDSKVEKPLSEYLKENGFEGCLDPEDGKIFYNKRLLEGHLRYKEYIKSLEL